MRLKTGTNMDLSSQKNVGNKMAAWNHFLPACRSTSLESLFDIHASENKEKETPYPPPRHTMPRRHPLEGDGSQP